MMKIRMFALVLSFSLFPAAAAAAPAPAALPGIWEGNIGTLPVRACFRRQEWNGRVFGAYYYLSRLRLIALDAEEDAGDGFVEGGGQGAGAARWRIEGADGAQLTARWTGNGRALPVRLRRLQGGEGEAGACASPAFHQPRLAGVRTVSRRASKDGVAYTRLALDTGGHFEINVETFALDGDSAAVRRVNASLGEALAGNPPSWFECVAISLEQGPNEGSNSETLTPSMISRRWLSVTEQYDGFCGGAHPNSGSAYRTYDLASGARIDLHDWLLPTATHSERLEGPDEPARTLMPAFRTFILRGWRPADRECGETVRDEEYWNIGLTRAGLVFSPSLPHVAQACGEEIVVGFDRLGPWLTREGAENIRAFRAEH
jgi:hypothetical protein